AQRHRGTNHLEVVTQTHQVHIAQVVGAGGEHVFVFEDIAEWLER
ncbi:hypothetical protein ABFP14_003725, partial [Enterobacter hormaechei]